MEKAEAQGRFLQKVYSRIATRYESTNHILTFGLDVMWRKKTAKLASGYFARQREGSGEAADHKRSVEAGAGSRHGPASSCSKSVILDLCTGTGEMAQLLRRKAKESPLILGLDFSKEMLLEAAVKDVSTNGSCGGPGPSGASYLCADTDDLPFPDNSIDLATMAFAMRNNNPDRETLSRRIREIERVLRPGGHFVNLETSQPSNGSIRWLRDLFARSYVKNIGGLLTGNKPGFAYLAGSIQGFYGSDELADLFAEAGLDRRYIKKMMLGMIAIHVFQKDPRATILRGDSPETALN